MSKGSFKFDYVEIEKQKFHSSKRPISTNDVDIPNAHSKSSFFQKSTQHKQRRYW